ncbi:hypothetical protein [Pseudomonas sp. MWU13-2105]|uniref:hypothetical protein n=1 Tax=Pseudomonas sp. MWU13-2105 TaxID=2935074 RepID=UPI00200F7365|nr:hypothetical protein [Pseudomonas sp. MWU13-2105]
MSRKIAPPAPLIPLLGSDNALDLGALGSDDLVTYVQYPGIAVGHVIAPQWRGRANNGQAIDETVQQDVDARLEYDDNGEPRMPIPIVNGKVAALDQGEVFYSYSYAEDGSNTFTEESLRLFFYVGKRPWMSSLLLPVAHLKESHDLCVDPDQVSPQGATITTAAYQAMAEGDELELLWQVYRPGSPTPITHRIYKTVTAEEVGRPLEWNLSYVQLQLIKNGGHALMSYSVIYANPPDPAAPQTYSAVQRIVGVAPSVPLLEAPAVVGHAGGQIDPSLYPHGVPLQIPAYPGLQVGDSVVVYADSESSSTQVALRLDISNVESGIIQLLLDVRWLQAHYGEEVSLSYQYARAGASLNSTPLALTVRRALRLLAPIVPEGHNYDDDGSGILKGWISASNTQSGVLVDIPEQGEIARGDQRWLVWSGYGEDTVVERPITGSDWRYRVPVTEIPANLGKHVIIKYAVVPSGESDPYWSPVFDLEIRNFEGGWPVLQAENPKVSDGKNGIKLSDVVSVMVFKTGSWRFMNEGQLLRVIASGMRDSDGQTIVHTLRDESEPLTEEESYDQGYVLTELPRSFMVQLRVGEEFDVASEVSFDNGYSYKSFGISAFKLLL